MHVLIIADTWDRLLNMRNRGAAPAQLAKSTFESAWMLFSNRKPSNRFRPLLNDLSRVYVDYNVAQASYVPSQRSRLEIEMEDTLIA